MADEHPTCSFSGHAGKTLSLRFFRGSSADVISPEQIEAQSRSAALQHRLGKALVTREAPKSANTVVNVKELISQL